MSQQDTVRTDQGELFLCPTCLATNDPRNDFCEACRAPLSGTSSIDPIKNIWARGFLYREMCHGRPSRIVLIGAWFLVLGSAIGILIFGLGGGILITAPCLLLLAVHGIVLYRTTKNCLRKLKHPARAEPGFARNPL